MEFICEGTRIYSNDSEGKLICEILYPETEKNVYCITHTFVDSAYGGQGIAGKLVRLAVDDIRSKGGEVTATCSYAVKWLEKNA